MAPIKGTKTKGGPSKPSNKRSSKPSSGPPGGVKKRTSSKPTVKPKTVQQKTKSNSNSILTKKKKRIYTAKELNIPELNGIIPNGITKPPNMKKGKNFVDDKEGMNAILAVVMAEKEGNIESKMMRSRQLEEVREARKVEMEGRKDYKKAKLEERKERIKEKGRKRSEVEEEKGNPGKAARLSREESKFKPRKKVSFGVK
nr:hypothetical protein B0A51_18074 [Rachicladosporium sp. CCFEE 5018]